MDDAGENKTGNISHVIPALFFHGWFHFITSAIRIKVLSNNPVTSVSIMKGREPCLTLEGFRDTIDYMDQPLIAKFLEATRVLSGPKRRLAAYGPTNIEYHLISSIDDLTGKTRLREGSVVSERPLILTSESLRERFEGFGEDGREFTRWLTEEYHDLLRALEYKFRNKDLHTRVLNEDSRVIASRIRQDLESRSATDAVLIQCPDAAWSLALMKFTLDEASKAFPGHIRSFEEHGLFDPAGTAMRRRKAEIEKLFKLAASNPATRTTLGKILKEYGLFQEYEDRFLSLFN
jgi:hypothetical protein